MPAIPRIAQYTDEPTRWRHDIHAHPELGASLSARLVEKKLARV
jgi:metal-dependent amidase/aminoacylase/carboxypeptidase family protein